MRVGLIADIHGNTLALNEVLAVLEDHDVDVIVCLGDLAANGPDPVGAVERIADLGCPVVVGNTDMDMIEPPEWWHDPEAVGAPARVLPIVEISLWCAEQLNDNHRRFLSELSQTIDMDLEDVGQLLAFHGSPSSASDLITANTPSDDLDGMLAGAHQSILAGGHSHVPLVRRIGTTTFVNPGSVGLPFAGYGSAGEVPVLNHAAFGLVTAIGSELTIELAQVALDPDRLTEQVRSSGMPHAEWWLDLRR